MSIILQSLHILLGLAVLVGSHGRSGSYTNQINSNQSLYATLALPSLQ